MEIKENIEVIDNEEVIDTEVINEEVINSEINDEEIKEENTENTATKSTKRTPKINEKTCRVLSVGKGKTTIDFDGFGVIIDKEIRGIDEVEIKYRGQITKKNFEIVE